MHISAVGVLFLLVGSSLGESGDSPDAEDDEDPEQDMRPSVTFECFSKVRLYQIQFICNVTKRPYESKKSVYFKICTGTKCEKRKENEPLKIEGALYERKVCIIGGAPQDCEDYNVIKRAVPESPSLSIYYNNQSEEYICNITTPYTGYEYLKDNLIHEAVMRKEGEEWPVCEEQTVSNGGYKMCFQNDFIRIPKRNLEYSTKYEARLRSKPNGKYYDGLWSNWSKTTYFETEPNEFNKNDVGEEESEEDFLIVILCCCAVVIILIFVIVLTKLFWKDRIKPLIWPEVPDHKNALEKLCISPTKYIQISFNPDFFDNYHINKVDFMKAQVRTEDILQVSATDTQLEKQLDANSCNNTSAPAVGSKESSTLMSHTGHCIEPSDHMAANGTHEVNSLEKPTNPENVLLSFSDCGSKSIISSDNPSTPGAAMENVPAYSCAVKQPNNGLRGLCWEDISMYIAMSAFKTPNTVIKQPLNI